MNQTIIGMLQCLLEQCESKWCHHFNKLIHPDNRVKSSASCYSPYDLLFGRHPRLPIDVLKSQNDHTETYLKYAKRFEDQMRQAYQIVKNPPQARKKKDINRHNLIQK